MCEHRERGEIEITPEMIRAGVQVYVSEDPEFENDATIVRKIFVAMCAAHNQGSGM